MIKKQNLRINVLAAAVLAMTGTGLAQAASPPVSAPLSAPRTQQADGIIVKYRSGTAAASDAASKVSVVNAALSRATVGGANLGAAARSAAFSPQVARRLGIGADLIRLNARLGEGELSRVLAELKADPAVEYAVADAIMYPLDLPASARVQARPSADAGPNLVPNDPYYQSHNWHFHNPVGGVNAPAAWDVSQGEGIVVAVLDTGILPEHPDFAAGTLLQGYDFISDAQRSRRPANGRVPGALDHGDWMTTANECYAGSPVRNSTWHGTHVTGTIAEATNNGVDAAGLAYKAKVLPVRVLGYCGGTLSDITDAITWASGGTVAGIPANPNPAEIINMSLGGAGSCDPAYQAAITGATNRGTLVVVAAGNEGYNVSNSRPANCDGVVSVAATGITGAIASYSNFGTRIDLSGPGGGVVDGNPNGYVWQAVSRNTTSPPESGVTTSYTIGGKAGTSMAAPHVAAVAALVQSALIANARDPLAPAALRQLLKDSARPFPVAIPAATPIGTGIVDAKRALDLALAEPCTENCEPEGTPLTNKVPFAGASGAAGSETVFRFEAQAGKPLSVLTYGGSGNVSLYLAQGRVPSATDNDARSTRPGNSETVRVAAPAAGAWYVKVVGEAAFSGVSILATQ
ncbi:S8 family serine peptidase [Stenotrophomonas sp. 24(2023)]|uniref:S8 family serine peptidase n=1 Tax=Stenotrophomonas sp. 24(2023) TaxID=3068324 RepID=UPI0027E1DEA7|nr:S8 family serine peptidase [Stenotrophomonas sp. 24(2023)]WMJ67776.1 S8 family serine peptidase [Stenotrophomonas sp. 24(2023)]